MQNSIPQRLTFGLAEKRNPHIVEDITEKDIIVNVIKDQKTSDTTFPIAL